MLVLLLRVFLDIVPRSFFSSVTHVFFFFFKCKSSFKDVFFLFSYHVERRRPTYDDVVREVVCAWGSGLSTRSLIEYMRFFRDFFTEDYKRYSSTIRDCGRVKLAKRP